MRASPLFKYNPGQSSPQEIEATFVARKPVLEGILKDLRSRGRSKSNQHYLIIGPRGIGKTNLLMMIKQQVLNDKALAKAYLPIQAAEEEYSIIGLRDLVTRILELISQEPDQDFSPDLQSIRTITDDEEAAERAISVLKELSGKTKKKILLLVDSLDLILGNQFSDEAQIGRLRDLLMNESFLVLVGTAPTYFSEVSGYDRPLYNFFKTVHLEELTLEELTDLLKKRAEWDRNKSFLDNLEQIKPKLRALHHLTGGNPRLALILYQLLTQTTLPEIQADLQMLLDDLTPYYKARLESLPAQQRKVMDTFARLGRPATPTELAEETRFPVNQVNSILQRLREHGFVAPARQKRRRTTLYVVSERVFRVWHQMRFSPESRRRLEFLVEFIRVWYSADGWTQGTYRLNGEDRKTAGDSRIAERGPHPEHFDLLDDCARSLFSDDRGRARDCFQKFLEKSSVLDPKRSHEDIVGFFRGVAKEEIAEQLAIFLEIMRERSMNDELDLLMPFAKAVEYWQKGKDEEVLDRLNPEIREMVEKIIQGSSGRASSKAVSARI